MMQRVKLTMPMTMTVNNVSNIVIYVLYTDLYSIYFVLEHC